MGSEQMHDQDSFEIYGPPEELEFMQSITDPEDGVTGDVTMRVQIVGKQKIGHGGFGNIYRVQARTIEDGRTKEDTFVIKDFGKNYTRRPKMARLHAENAHNNWRKVRDAGIHTWPLYLIAKDKPFILMNDGEPDGSLLMASHNSSISQERLGQLKVSELDNFEKTLDDAASDAAVAGEHGLVFGGHVWVTRLVPASEGHFRMEYFVGDVDHVWPAPDTMSPKAAADKNLEILQDALFVDLMALPDLDDESWRQCSAMIIQKIGAMRRNLK